MRYTFAPMEGVTTHIYRRLHRRFFPGIDRYYTPFLSPTQHHKFGKRDRDEVLPAHNEGVPLVPQLMTKSAPDFNWAVAELAGMGYSEVNLNLGCPSGTVVPKGKGCGALADLEKLERFLDEIFALPAAKLSIKTRLGLTNPEEFIPILELYNRYPIAELTIHPRLQTDYYKLPVHPDWFAYGITHSKNPVCYNGDLRTAADCVAMTAAHPSLTALMLGRGLLANPALVTAIKGGLPADVPTLRRFHDALFEDYRSLFGHDSSVIHRMKEYWFHLLPLFAADEKLAKQLRKTKGKAEYFAAVEAVFRSGLQAESS
jgi:tRNA-dihydrouridine synthase